MVTFKFFFGLYLTSLSFICFSQNQIIEAWHQDYIDAGFCYSEIDSTYIRYESFSTSSVLGGKFKILARSVGLEKTIPNHNIDS